MLARATLSDRGANLLRLEPGNVVLVRLALAEARREPCGTEAIGRQRRAVMHAVQIDRRLRFGAVAPAKPREARSEQLAEPLQVEREAGPNIDHALAGRPVQQREQRRGGVAAVVPVERAAPREYGLHAPPRVAGQLEVRAERLPHSRVGFPGTESGAETRSDH